MSAVTTTKDQERLAKYNLFAVRAIASGGRITAFPCPQCGFVTITHKPPRGDKFDTLANCPSCGVMYWKEVHDNGTVLTDIKMAEMLRGA